MQYGATAHIATCTLNVSCEVFEDRLINHKLWCAWSSDLIPVIFDLWGDIKDIKYSNNPQTLDELRQSSHETITFVRVIYLKLVSDSFARLEVCLGAEGQHFQHRV
jgi:hypothetical protein